MNCVRLRQNIRKGSESYKASFRLQLSLRLRPITEGEERATKGGCRALEATGRERPGAVQKV